jgi:tRNA (cytidine/uridine-2'-O-)-methyltransferase
MTAKNFFNIVLFQPEIPQNTGNIARMCVANDLHLHLIRPLGFEISDKHLKRSAMDYWHNLKYDIHENWAKFLDWRTENAKQSNLYFFSSKTEKSYWDVKYETGACLVFGSEGAGLAPEMYEQYKENLVTIPMSSGKTRCLNLASSAQTAYYEAYRQNYTID